VFAAAAIFAGSPILEYKGEIISAKKAQRRYEQSTTGDGHSFFGRSTTDA
jgi:hypothetical protein